MLDERRFRGDTLIVARNTRETLVTPHYDGEGVAARPAFSADFDRHGD